MNTETITTEVDDDPSGLRGYNEWMRQQRQGKADRFDEKLKSKDVAYKETKIDNVMSTTLPNGQEIRFSMIPRNNKVKFRFVGTNVWKVMGTGLFISMCKGEVKPVTKFTFGKHKGKTVEEVYQQDRQYLMWCMNTITNEGLKSKIREVAGKYEEA